MVFTGQKTERINNGRNGVRVSRKRMRISKVAVADVLVKRLARVGDSRLRVRDER